MKKLFLLTITAGLALSSFAQNTKFAAAIKPANNVNVGFANAAAGNADYKTSLVTIHDSLLMTHIASTDTPFQYFISLTGTSYDSGFYSGMNFAGFNAFAERYDFNTTDSSVKVIGILPIFCGAVNASSTNQVTLKVWSQGAPALASSSAAYNGFTGNAS